MAAARGVGNIAGSRYGRDRHLLQHRAVEEGGRLHSFAFAVARPPRASPSPPLPPDFICLRAAHPIYTVQRQAGVPGGLPAADSLCAARVSLPVPLSTAPHTFAARRTAMLGASSQPSTDAPHRGGRTTISMCHSIHAACAARCRSSKRQPRFTACATMSKTRQSRRFLFRFPLLSSRTPTATHDRWHSL